VPDDLDSSAANDLAVMAVTDLLIDDDLRLITT
jgi:hypothetical protein